LQKSHKNAVEEFGNPDQSTSVQKNTAPARMPTEKIKGHWISVLDDALTRLGEDKRCWRVTKILKAAITRIELRAYTSCRRCAIAPDLSMTKIGDRCSKQ
jgi:hypothetical protein